MIEMISQEPTEMILLRLYLEIRRFLDLCVDQLGWVELGFGRPCVLCCVLLLRLHGLQCFLLRASEHTSIYEHTQTSTSEGRE